jgi:ABC-type Co2+ transport system permease subunit
MHIEPGYISQAKVLLANYSAIAVLGAYLPGLIRVPANLVRTILAAVFFSLFMQAFHKSVGPSELHFIGAMAIYLTLGFIPTLFGFALGLLLQGIMFEPFDLPHLAVNSLSLIVPLIAVHFTQGKQYIKDGVRLNWKSILKLDSIYYSGVTAMVGFWILIGDVETPFIAWAQFAASYLAIVALEPFVTYSSVYLLKKYQDKQWINFCFDVKGILLGSAPQTKAVETS